MIARSLIQFRGSFGKVRLLVDKSTQQKLAAKVIDKKPGHAMYMEQLQREVRVMKMMRRKSKSEFGCSCGPSTRQ